MPPTPAMMSAHIGTAMTVATRSPRKARTPASRSSSGITPDRGAEGETAGTVAGVEVVMCLPCAAHSPGMNPVLVAAPFVILAVFVGGMAATGHSRAEADARALVTQECRDVATAKYLAGDIDSVDAYDLALDECSDFR